MNRRPLGPQPKDTAAICVRTRPIRPMRPRLGHIGHIGRCIRYQSGTTTPSKLGGATPKPGQRAQAGKARTRSQIMGRDAANRFVLTSGIVVHENCRAARLDRKEP